MTKEASSLSSIPELYDSSPQMKQGRRFKISSKTKWATVSCSEDYDMKLLFKSGNDFLQMHAHRSVLAAASPHFANKFGIEEDNPNKICLVEFHSKPLHKIIHFIYFGEVEVEGEEEVEDFVEYGKYLELQNFDEDLLDIKSLDEDDEANDDNLAAPANSSHHGGSWGGSEGLGTYYNNFQHLRCQDYLQSDLPRETNQPSRFTMIITTFFISIKNMLCPTCGLERDLSPSPEVDPIWGLSD